MHNALHLTQMNTGLICLVASMLAALVCLMLGGWLGWRMLARRQARDAAQMAQAIDQFSARLGTSQSKTFAEEVAQGTPMPTAKGALAPVARAGARLFARMQAHIAALEWTASHDPMTGLLNASAFKLACQTRLAASDHAQGTLLIIGLAQFKTINDSLGHDGGDQLLCAVAERLRLVAPTFAESPAPTRTTAEPLIARLGGSEFALFLPGDLAHAEIERCIHRLQRVIGETTHVGAQSLRVKLSIGIALTRALNDPNHTATYDPLRAAADTALQAAKAEGAGEYCFYTPAMARAADDLLARELALREALEQGQFCLHYQPQLSFASGRIDSVEALIRWQHPTKGLIYPNDFIPFAEANGLIDDIGDWVILEAIRTAARWANAGHPLKMSINISPRQLARVELIAMIRACLARFALAPQLLEIEITEAAIMRDAAFSSERIAGLRRDGVTVALDDFGTGYSNLAQLMSLPMDRLKLDKSLIDTIVTDPRRQVVATAMIQMARQLGLEVVAEGVEDMAQFELLRLAGCDQIQGYVIARPLPEEALFGLIAGMGGVVKGIRQGL